MTTSRNFRQWADRIEEGTFTKGQTLTWANVVAPLARGFDVRKRTALSIGEARVLTDLLIDRPVGLTPEHTAAGLSWLTRYADKLHDAHGQPLNASPYSIHPRPIAELFDRFTFAGQVYIETYHDEYGIDGDGEGDPTACLPVWRVHLTDSRAFAYYAGPWQQSLGGRTPPPPSWWWLDPEEVST